jgi:hypothetical protein
MKISGRSHLSVGTKENHEKTQVGITGVQAEIRTEHLQNASLERVN